MAGLIAREQITLEERQRGDGVDLAREPAFGVLHLSSNTFKVTRLNLLLPRESQRLCGLSSLP